MQLLRRKKKVKCHSFPSSAELRISLPRLVCHLQATKDQSECPDPAEHEHTFMSAITQDISLRLITNWKRARTWHTAPAFVFHLLRAGMATESGRVQENKKPAARRHTDGGAFIIMTALMNFSVWFSKKQVWGGVKVWAGKMERIPAGEMEVVGNFVKSVFPTTFQKVCIYTYTRNIMYIYI